MIYGTKYSFKRVRENKVENVWPEISKNQNPLLTPFKCLSQLGYPPKIAMRRDRGILICFWNVHGRKRQWRHLFSKSQSRGCSLETRFERK